MLRSAKNLPIVLLDGKDVENRPASEGRFTAMAPTATLAATRAGFGDACTPAAFTDHDHARCVAASRRAAWQFDSAAARTGLPASTKVMGRQIAWQLAAIAHRIARSLPGDGCMIRGADGRWMAVADKVTGVKVLLPRILDWGLQHRSTAVAPPLPSLYRYLLRHRSSARGHGELVFAPRGKLKLGVDHYLRTAGAEIATVEVTRGGLDAYQRLARSWEVAIPPLALGDRWLARCLDWFTEIGNAFSDPLVRIAWAAYRSYFETSLAAAGAVLRDAPELMKRSRAALAVCYEANSWLASALLEAARSVNRPSVVVNHNAHARTGSPIADTVLRFLFEQRTANPLVSVSARWSPDWKHWDAGGDPVRHLPYRLAYPPPSSCSKRFRILHAGNYQNWSDFIPWVAETSHEYVAGLASLASALGAVTDMDLVIRVRAKSEVNPEVVRGLVPSLANVAVCGTEQDFLEQLADCDLLVSHFSTTVEQALQMGKPVLLWGSTQRFCQFAPQWALPTPEMRSAVYAVRDAQALPAMLRAIRDTHSARPLSSDEVARYRNSPQDPPLERLIAGMVGSAFAEGAWSLIGGDGSGWAGDEFYKVRGLAWHAGRLYASLSGPATDGPRGEVWAWDGELWELQAADWSARASFVEHLHSHGGFLYAAERNGIYRLDGARWVRAEDSLTVPGRCGPYAFADWQGRLVASYWGEPAIAVENDGRWTRLPAPRGGWGDGVRTVYCLQDYSGLLYAGTGTGKFSKPGAGIWRFDGQGWEKIGGGGVRGSWKEGGIPFVLSLNIYGGKLIATISRLPGAPRSAANVWAFDGARWEPVGAGQVPALMAKSLIMNDTAVYRGRLVVATGDGSHRNAQIWERAGDESWRAVGGSVFAAEEAASSGGYWIYRLCVAGEALFAGTAGHRGAARVFRFAP